MKEYPKWLHFEGKPSVLVNDAEEEKAVLGKTEPKAPKAKKEASE